MAHIFKRLSENLSKIQPILLTILIFVGLFTSYSFGKESQQAEVKKSKIPAIPITQNPTITTIPTQTPTPKVTKAPQVQVTPKPEVVHTNQQVENQSSGMSCYTVGAGSPFAYMDCEPNRNVENSVPMECKMDENGVHDCITATPQGNGVWQLPK